MVEGTVLGVRDCGTIVLVFLESGERRTLPLVFDHRSFQHLLEGERCDSIELVGRTITCDEDSLANHD